MAEKKSNRNNRTAGKGIPPTRKNESGVGIGRAIPTQDGFREPGASHDIVLSKPSPKPKK